MNKRDQQLIAWLARVKLATVEQIQAKFSWPRATTFRRIAECIDQDLLARDASFPETVVYATRKGLGSVHSPLSQARVRAVTIGHDLAATDAIITLESFGLSVLSEREIRSHESLHEDERYLIEVKDKQRSIKIKHTPDIAIVGGANKWIAVEVELTTKTVVRTRAILNGYGEDHSDLVGVLYLVPKESDCRRLTKLSEEQWMLKPFVAVKRDETELIDGAVRNILKSAGEIKKPVPAA